MVVLLLLIAGIVIYAFIKAKTRMYYANQAGAMRDLASGSTASFPSWGTNKDRVEEFILVIQSLAKRKGIPQSYVVATFSNKQTFQMLFQYAGKMEERRASFAEQQAATADLLVKIWTRLDADSKRKFAEIVLPPKTAQH